MNMRVPVSLMLIIMIHSSWARNDTLNGCTFCLRMNLKQFHYYDNFVVLESREVKTSIEIESFLATNKYLTCTGLFKRIWSKVAVKHWIVIA